MPAYPGLAAGATDQSCLRHCGRAQASFRRPLIKISFAPLGREDDEEYPFSTGSASGRSAAAPLHPWLQPVAPFGAETMYDAGAWKPGTGGHAGEREEGKANGV